MRTLSLATLILATIGTGLLSGAAIVVGIVVMPDALNPADQNVTNVFSGINHILNEAAWFWIVVSSCSLAVVVSVVAMMAKLRIHLFPMPKWVIVAAIICGVHAIGLLGIEHAFAEINSPIRTDFDEARWDRLNQYRLGVTLVAFACLVYSVAMYRQVMKDIRGTICA